MSRARRFRKEPTVAERRLWAALRKQDLKFRRQVPMGPYVVDFACHAAKLVIEVDGYYHQFPDAQRRDEARDAWLHARGYRVVRIDEKDVRERLLDVIDRIATEASTPIPNPSPLKGEGS